MPSGPAYHPSASALPAIRLWNQPDYQQRDPRTELKKKPQPPRFITPQELEDRLAKFCTIHERPAYAQEIAALQDKEVPLDQSSDHTAPSEVGSSGRSVRSEATSEAQRAACATLEMAAIQNFPDEISSETPSERNEREAGEGILMSSLDTLTGDDGEEGEYSGEEDSDDENEKEDVTSQAMKMKDAEPGGGKSKGKGVDG
ncbi:MAG: hypothetical protein GY835_10040 [bacterium]|nr:hypothetical protein [bacterium]